MYMYVNVHVYITYFICMFKGGNVCFEEIQILEQLKSRFVVYVCVYVCTLLIFITFYLFICLYVFMYHSTTADIKGQLVRVLSFYLP